MYRDRYTTIYCESTVTDRRHHGLIEPLPYIDFLFQYNGKHYKQLNRTARESPVSVVVAEIVMQLADRQTIPLWLRYVDDTFTAVHKDEIDDFYDHLNDQSADIQSDRRKSWGKLPFLDCLVSRDSKRTANDSVQCTVYSVQCTVYSVQCTVYSVQCTVYSVQCTVYSVQCTSLQLRYDTC